MDGEQRPPLGDSGGRSMSRHAGKWGALASQARLRGAITQPRAEPCSGRPIFCFWGPGASHATNAKVRGRSAATLVCAFFREPQGYSRRRGERLLVLACSAASLAICFTPSATARRRPRPASPSVLGGVRAAARERRLRSPRATAPRGRSAARSTASGSARPRALEVARGNAPALSLRGRRSRAKGRKEAHASPNYRAVA